MHGEQYLLVPCPRTFLAGVSRGRFLQFWTILAALGILASFYERSFVKRVGHTLWSRRVYLLVGIVALAVGWTAGWLGGRESVDQKLNDEDVEVAFSEGQLVGEERGEADAQAELREARSDSYWNAWEEGLEEGEEAGEKQGRRFGAELATPEDLDFSTRYMVTYEPSQAGPMLRSYLEMPLNTIWECEDLDGCTEIIP
jgi:hypothetical protein